jgi:hypothetical protein
VARHVAGERSAVGRQLLHELPVADFAVRAAVDLDSSHAAHEGPRVFDGFRVGRGHGQQRARSGQAIGLGRRGELAEVPDALEARGQHMLQEAADEQLAIDGDGALAAGGIGAHAQQHVVAGDGHSRSLPMAVRCV